MQAWTELEFSKRLLDQEEAEIPSLEENDAGEYVLLQPLTKGRNAVLVCCGTEGSVAEASSGLRSRYKAARPWGQ